MSQKRARGRRQRPSRKGPLLTFLLLCLVVVLGALAVRTWFSRPDAVQGEPNQPDGTPSQTDPVQEDPTRPSPATARQRARTLLEEMTLWEQVCQLFIVTPEELTGIGGPAIAAGETTRSALEEYPVGGLVYFTKNLVDPDQTTAMIQNSQSYAKLNLFISVDEEGGAVARLGKNDAFAVTRFGPMGEISSDEEARSVGATLGQELAAYGFNLDFAPVADVNTNPDNPVIGSRAFSSDGAVAAQRVAAAVEGFHSGGMLCCLKHFPGHGDTAADSHTGYAQTSKTWEELTQVEMLPFQAGIRAGADLVMVGHIAAPNVTGTQTPASLSYDLVTGRLREELGFTGVVCTDAMNMGAISQTYSPGEAALQAIQAGVDIILMPGDLRQAAQGLMDAVEAGTLTQARVQESVLRVLTLKCESGIL